MVSIKEIHFNPTYIDPYNEENGFYTFEVGDDDIKIDVKIFLLLVDILNVEEMIIASFFIIS